MMNTNLIYLLYELSDRFTELSSGGGVGPDLFPGLQRRIPSGGVKRGDRIQYDGQANPDRPPDEFAYKIGFGLELATVLDQHISDVPHDGFLSAIYS